MILGRATRDAQELESKTGKGFIKFSVAVNEYRGKNTDARVVFYDIASFARSAKSTAKRVRKGDIVFVTGTPELNQYEDKQGNAKAGISVLANYVSPFNYEKMSVEATGNVDDSTDVLKIY